MKNGLIDTNAVLDRMKRVCGFATDADLVRYLGQKPSTLSNWRQNNRLPIREVVEFAQRNGLTLDYLLLGNMGAGSVDRLSGRHAPRPRGGGKSACLPETCSATNPDQDRVP